MALVDVETMTPLSEIPIPLRTATLKGRARQNLLDVSAHDGKLRMYCMSHQHKITLHTYEAQPDSPFQLAGGPRSGWRSQIDPERA